MLAMLVLARLCLILINWGSLGLATAATYVSHACPCPLLFNIIFSVLLFYPGQLVFAMNLVLLFHYWGLLWDSGLYSKAVLPLPVYCMLTVYLSLSLGRLGGSLCGNSMFSSIFVLVV